MSTTIISKVMSATFFPEDQVKDILLLTWWKFYQDGWNDPDWMEAELTSLGLDFDKDFQMFWNKQWITGLKE